MRIKAPWGKHITLEPSAEAIWRVLERGVQDALTRYPPPPDPYAADIAYRREPLRPNGSRRDNYQPWWEVIAQRHGDCEDLSMMLVAYLRGNKIDPYARVALIEWPNGGWHAVVLRYGARPETDETYEIADLERIYGTGARIYGGRDIGWDPADPGWYVEDPSRRLGMRDPARGSAYSPVASAEQREPRGESVIGRDVFVPFEIAGAATPDDETIDAATMAEILRWLA